MNKNITILILMPALIFLYGCPYSSPYPIDKQPVLPIDTTLIGKWATFIEKPSNSSFYKEEPVKVILSKFTDSVYSVSITGYINELKPFKVIDNDSIKGIAYLSAVQNRQLLNTFIGGKVYIAEVKKKNNTVSLLPLSERITSKLIKSCMELRIALDFHYKISRVPLYDEQFSLTNLQKVN